MPIRPTKLFALAILVLTSFAAVAQTPGMPQAPQPSGTEVLLKPGELEALVAPIALYPDSLLSLVLMASTYPLEVVQADRWLGASRLKGDELKAAVDKQGWDDSVKSLAATPTVLTMMSTKLDWTQKLGDAVLAQQEDVMDAVQRLRVRAQSNDKLKTTKEQTVTTTQVNNKPVIVVEQTDPNTVYVPYYEPSVAYGTWPYEEYPPYTWGAPGYIAGGLLATGLAFGTGYALGRWAAGGNWWGGGVNWGNRNLINNRPTNINNIGNNWAHRPEHRHGVRYNNAGVAQKFAGNNNLRSSAGQRQDFRGRDGAGPGGDRAGPGDRPGGDRASAGTRDRPGGDKAGNRAGAGGAKGDRGAGKQAKGGSKAGNRQAANRGGAGPGGGARAGGAGPRRDAALGNINSGRMASAHSVRGHASLGAGAGRSFAAGGGGFRGGSVGMGGGGFRGGGGGGGRGGGGGGRRSDIALKENVDLLGHLGSGLGFYRFNYIGENTVYVGVMAQDVQKVMPGAVTRDAQGFLRVSYDSLGLPFQTFDEWIASKTPALASGCAAVSGICRPTMQ